MPSPDPSVICLVVDEIERERKRTQCRDRGVIDKGNIFRIAGLWLDLGSADSINSCRFVRCTRYNCSVVAPLKVICYDSTARLRCNNPTHLEQMRNSVYSARKAKAPPTFTRDITSVVSLPPALDRSTPPLLGPPLHMQPLSLFRYGLLRIWSFGNRATGLIFEMLRRPWHLVCLLILAFHVGTLNAAPKTSKLQAVSLYIMNCFWSLPTMRLTKSFGILGTVRYLLYTKITDLQELG
jgi:hypothetical protein